MAPQVYPKPLSSFATDMAPAPVATIPVVAEGRAALERINKVGQPRCVAATKTVQSWGRVARIQFLWSAPYGGK